MPPRKRATADTSPIVGTFSVADNATVIGDGPKAAPNLPPPDIADELPPVEKPDVKRRIGKLEKNLTDTYQTVGMFVGMVDRYCGQTIMDESETMAASMVEWAEEDPKVKAALLRMTTASAFGKVLAAHAPVLMAIGSHHVPAIRKTFFPAQDAEPVEAVPTDDYGNPVGGTEAA